MSFYEGGIALLPSQSRFGFRRLKRGVRDFHGGFVSAPADGASCGVFMF